MCTSITTEQDTAITMDYDELLSMAHTEGLKSLIVDVVQIPTTANAMTAVCRATVIMDGGKTFSDIAVVDLISVGSVNQVNSLLTMASTHAKARTLYDALGKVKFKQPVSRPTPISKDNEQATLHQIAAIEKLCKRLSRKADPQLFSTLNKVAASRLIVKLQNELKNIG